MKTIYIFFGEMGCGKSYCGERYAKKHGFDFFEGDSVVTPRMLERVSKFKPISRDILDEYLDVLADAIADAAEKCDHLVVSQALYINEDRQSIKIFLESLGYKVRMWWVKVSFWRNFRNLLTRQDGWKWALYWLINKPFFQSPDHDHDVYYNIYG
jgi:gluconate kinase